MAMHDFKVYPYHLAFLEKFPELKAWLNCRGFTIMYSHQDFKMGVIYTFWSDYPSEPDTNGEYSALDYIVIAYCQHCKTVEVYRRGMIATAENEKEMILELDRMPVAADTPAIGITPVGAGFPQELLDREIDRMLNE